MEMETEKTKKLTWKQELEVLAAEKGATLTCKNEKSFRRGRRGTNTITDRWYELSTLPNKKFTRLADVQNHFLYGE
jgi:hypothetical protein